jgi:hypothetical protein
MAAVITEKSADDLRREIDELNRQHREVRENVCYFRVFLCFNSCLFKGALVDNVDCLC